MSQKLDDIAKAVMSVATSKLKLSDPTKTTALTGMRVFDVGQGDCIGLLDQNQSVFCYVDYGGLGDHPDRGSTTSNPSSVRLSVNYSGTLTTIVLTHWDKDHYYSAKKFNLNAQQCQWLVPRQLASPQAVRFAAGLPNAHCWPEARGQTTVKFNVGPNHSIEIRKCQAYVPNASTEDRNSTGLAITLLHFEHGRLKHYMLLPGDCHFDGIPNLPIGPIRALIAYHHGSRTHWGATTKNAIVNPLQIPRDMAYSFGKNNIYRHPRRYNYKKEWHLYSIETPDLRAKCLDSLDFLW